MSKPPLGIGVKRNDLRPWRALAPTRLSWRDPSCGNRWLPGATPPAAPPRPTTTTALLTWGAPSSPAPATCVRPNVSQTSRKPLPGGSRTSPRRLPNPSPPSPSRLPSRLPDLSQPSPRRLPEGGGIQMVQKWKKRHFSVLGEKESKKSENEHIFHFGTPK